eukprot:scpid11421/ scgid25987/ Serine-protein kinase ATM; Ataxia telangiectasia mutated homolog
MESEAVLDFKTNCIRLESGKVNERRAAAQRVYELLDRSDVQSSLESDGSSGGGELTWDRLLARVRKFVLKEAEPTTSRGRPSTAGRNAKRYDAVKLFKQVVRKADRNGPRLNCKEVFHHVLTIFKDDNLCAAFGADYAAVLLRDLLPVRRYHCEVTTAMWCDLLERVTGFLSDRSPHFDRNVLARLLHLLIEHASVQCGHNIRIIKTVMPFFDTMLKSASDQTGILGDVLSAFNILAVTSSMNVRGYLCRLGESAWSEVLKLLKKPAPTLRDPLLRFLVIQLRAHHPQGCFREDSGGWAANERMWRKNLASLYAWLLSELESENRRLKKKDTGQKPLFIILFVDVFHQMFLQESHGRSQASLVGPPANWQSLCEMMSVNAVPWLQIATTLLETHPGSMPDEDVIPTLEHLHQLQTDTKKLDPLVWTVKCLTALVPIARKCKPSQTVSLSTGGAKTNVWKKVWSSAWRSISVHHAEDQCFSLLTAMVENKLVEPDYEPWQVFSAEGGCYPASNAVNFLACYLQHYDLPDDMQLRRGFALAGVRGSEPPEPGSAEDVQSSYPLRFRLVQWLLSSFGSTSALSMQHTNVLTSTFAPSGVIASVTAAAKGEGRRVAPQVLATVLVALTHRAPSSCHAFWNLLAKDSAKSKRLSVLDDDGSEALESFLADQAQIELNHLQSTFDKPPFAVVHDHVEDISNSRCDGAFLSSLQVYLCTVLVQMCGTVPSAAADGEGTMMSRERLNVLSARLERECRLISLSVHLVRQLVLSSSMTVDDIRDAPLLVHLTALGESVADGLKDSSLLEVDADTRCRSTARILTCLQPAFACLMAPPGLPIGDMPLIVGMCQLFQDDLQLDALLDQLYRISTCQWPPARGLTADSARGRSVKPSSPRVSRTVANADASFDEDDQFDMDETTAVSMGSENTRAAAASKETYVLHPSLLSSQARLAVLATRILSSWACSGLLANRGSGRSLHTNRGQLSLSGTTSTPEDSMKTESAVCTHLFAWLASQDIDYMNPWDIQQALVIMREFVVSSVQLSTDVLRLFLDSLRNIMSQYRRDQRVSAEVLHLLALTVPHLTRLGSGEQLGKDHQATIHLLNAFWALYEDGMLATAVKLELASFIEALLKADPHLTWVEIKVKNRSGGQHSPFHLDAAVCRLLSDTDHAVRMYAVAILPRLFLLPSTTAAWPRLALPYASVQRKVQLLALPQHTAWDTCLVNARKEQQRQVFALAEEALTVLYDDLQSMDGLPDAIYEDEGVNRICSSLAAAAQIAVCSPLCEKQALMYIFRSSVDDEEIVPCKVLGLISQQMGHSSTSQYLSHHTEYLLHQWRCEKQKLSVFPYKLYGMSSILDFYRQHLSQVVLHLLVRCDEGELTAVAQELGSEWPELVEPHIGKFTVLTLPCFAAEATDGSTAEANDDVSQAAIRADAFLREKLSKEAVDRLFTRQIDEFVVQLLLHVHISPGQTGEYSAFASSTDAEPNPPVYTVAQAKATLHYMSQFHHSEQPSLLACLSRWRDCIQRIVLSLQLQMYHAHHSAQRRRYFLLYAIFMEIVFKEASQKLALARVFLLRDIVHTTVHLLQQTPPFETHTAQGSACTPTNTQRCQLHLVGACCHLLTVVCRLAVTSSVDELSKHLSLIVASLLPHASQATVAGKKALSLLDFLIRTNASPRLSESVATLDPLPDAPEFQRMRDAQLDLVDGPTLTLVSELKRFLSASADNKSRSRADGVCNLRAMLQQEHEQLKLVTSRHPALTGHLSDGTETLVMHLISELKRLCEVVRSPPPEQSNADADNVQQRQQQHVHDHQQQQQQQHGRAVGSSSMHLEVAKCLGELATPDLLTVAMVKHTDDKDLFCERFKDSCTDYCIAVVLHRLSQLLVDPNVDVVSATAECLKAILATAPGRSFIATYGEELDNLVPYLDPFLPGRKQRVYEPASSQHSSYSPVEVDKDELWLPWALATHTTHAEWICNLSSVLIQCGGIVDEVLLCLRPICRIKVEMAEAVFPFLIHHVLQQGDTHYTVLSRLARQFFAHCSLSFASPNSSAASSAAASSTGHSMSYVVRSAQSGNPAATAAMASVAGGGGGGDTAVTLPPAQSMKTMLDMLAFLRHQNRQVRVSSRHAAQPTVWDNNFWLDLDFFDVAATAQACKAPFTALLYIQIGCDAQRRTGYLDAKATGGQEDPVLIDGSTPDATKPGDLYSVPMTSFLPSPHRSLLLEVYTSIGETDSLYSVGADLMGNVQTRLCTYVQEGEWYKAIGTYNTEVMKNGHTTYTAAGLLECLQQLGLEHISSVYFDGLLARHPEEAAQVAEFQYQAAWRSMQWDVPQGNRNGKTSGYHQSLHSCLQWLRSSELSSVDNALSEMRTSVVDQLCLACLESTHGVYPILSRLQSLVEVEEVTDVLRGKLSLQLLSDRWQLRTSLMNEDFSTVEPVLALRSALLHVLSEHPNFNQSVTSSTIGAASGMLATRSLAPVGGNAGLGPTLVLTVLSETLESTAQRAREAGQLQIAERVMFNLQQLHQGPGKATFMSTSKEWLWQLEYCRLFWARDEHRTALHMLRQLTDQLDKRQGASESAAILYPQVLCQYGQWLADTHNTSPTTIMNDYMEKAVNLMSCICEKAPKAAMEAFFAVARFADKQHTMLLQQMSSTEEEDKEESIKKQVAELDQLSSASVRHESTREVKHYVRLLKLAKETDSKYLERFRLARNHFLISSLKNYLRCLQAGDAYDLRIFRLISLWFDNLMEKEVDALMAAELPRLQSRKLLPLLYQLAARISCNTLEGTQFQQTVAKIIEKLCLDHPHHSLYVILALRNANEGTSKSSAELATPPPAKRMRRQVSSQPKENDFSDDKIRAAQAIVQRVAIQKPVLVDNMCRLCEAYNQLAYENVQHLKGKTAHPQPMPSGFKLLKMKKLDLVAVTASNIEVDPACEYKNLITIDHFLPNFHLVGGINMPKRIVCVGSDGIHRQLLVKGQDDLRQDAVMQQVFEMVNQWLKRDTTTKKRQLRIRTYKVIPLSQRSGVVQWCVDTMPLGQYLVVGDQSAHRRYQPTAPTNMRCRETLMNAKTPEAKLKAYTDITKAFLPVFRYFFLENFSDPSQWFEHSLVYTRSAATASIVGYIMGLGDRHCQNILIDRRTAEVIHIDLGVAFEQGKALPTPETIPFRLTRDIVDGMGLSGTEGMFRRCSEATLQLMKQSCEELLTIVQVLLYDPLYQWTVSPVKARKLQGDGGGGIGTPQGTQTSGGGAAGGGASGQTGNASSGSRSMESSSSRKMAEHVLKRMQQKLQGIEEEGVALSVSGQVAHLIQEATNESNLCRVFPGWQPWV